MTTGLSGPDAALVHGFRGGRGEEDTGDAENPEKAHINIESYHPETESYGP